ncbi:hypothetical protein J7L68_00760 [bacterium]|nr:hypothetical protein [bacterium]
MWHLLLKTKPKLIWRLIARKGLEHWAKIIVAIIVIGLFFTGAYELFYRVFAYLKDVSDIGPILIDRLISIGFLAFFAMLIISNLVSSISTLFRSTETKYLMATPLSHSDVFWSRFLDNFFYSSWATAIIGLPMVLAYVVVNRLPIWQTLWAGILLLLFLLIPAFIGTISSMILFLIAKKISMKKTVAILVLLSLGIIYFYLKSNLAGGMMFNVMGDLSMLNYYLRQLGSYRNPYFPHIWFSEALRTIRLENWHSVMLFSSAMFSSAIFGFFITDLFAKWLYFPSFEAALSISGQKKTKRRSIFKSKLWKLFAPFPRDMRAMMVKDTKLFIRDPNQWSQFAVLLVLLAVYLANLRFVPSRIDSLLWQTIISFVNFGFSGYILATLSVRFVYPAISMEGKSFWSIISSPLSVKTLFWEKFTMAFVVFFILAEIVAVISNGILSQSTQMIILTAFGILLMSISLVGLNVGLGIIFPNFEELNPMRIASSGGGMIAALLSLIYVGIVVAIIALPTYRYTSYLTLGDSFSNWEIFAAVVALIIVNVAATLIPLKLGLKSIVKREF